MPDQVTGERAVHFMPRRTRATVTCGSGGRPSTANPAAATSAADPHHEVLQRRRAFTDHGVHHARRSPRRQLAERAGSGNAAEPRVPTYRQDTTRGHAPGHRKPDCRRSARLHGTRPGPPDAAQRLPPQAERSAPPPPAAAPAATAVPGTRGGCAQAPRRQRSSQDAGGATQRVERCFQAVLDQLLQHATQALTARKRLPQGPSQRQIRGSHEKPACRGIETQPCRDRAGTVPGGTMPASPFSTKRQVQLFRGEPRPARRRRNTPGRGPIPGAAGNATAPAPTPPLPALRGQHSGCAVR